MNKKSTKAIKAPRKTLTHIKKGYLDKEKEQEKVPAYVKEKSLSFYHYYTF